MSDTQSLLAAIERVQAQLARIEREQAKAETHIEHIRKAADANAGRLDAIAEKLPAVQVDVAKLTARQGAMSAALGAIAGFFGSKI